MIVNLIGHGEYKLDFSVIYFLLEYACIYFNNLHL